MVSYRQAAKLSILSVVKEVNFYGQQTNQVILRLIFSWFCSKNVFCFESVYFGRHNVMAEDIDR